MHAIWPPYGSSQIQADVSININKEPMSSLFLQWLALHQPLPGLQSDP